MYNGIGLPTARGSGTNAYVQANRANLTQSKKRVTYNSEADIRRSEAELNRQPNQELLDHMKKRQIELRCADFEMLMEDKGFDQAKIEARVSEYRKLLLSQVESGELDIEAEIDAKDTHARAKAAIKGRDRMRAALGIDEKFVDGSSFERLNKKSGTVVAEESTGTNGDEKGKHIDKKKKKKAKRRRSKSPSCSKRRSSSSSSSSSSCSSSSCSSSSNSSDSDSDSDSSSDSKSSSTKSGWETDDSPRPPRPPTHTSDTKDLKRKHPAAAAAAAAAAAKKETTGHHKSSTSHRHATTTIDNDHEKHSRYNENSSKRNKQEAAASGGGRPLL